jgi:haloacetate dehalogenase
VVVLQVDAGDRLDAGRGSVIVVFRGFDEFDLSTSQTTIHGVRGGAGPPVLLLHGIPETHLMWHRVAPALAERFTVVATDLRGFGASGKPPSTPDHEPYRMRVMANDQVEVMAAFGFDRFAVVGHDRGARCAYRMALDHPAAVSRLAVLDIVPTGEAYARADRDFSLGYWVWSFLAAPAPVPEELIGAAPRVLVEHMLDSWSAGPDVFPAHLRDAYVAPFTDPATVHAICEEYRAAATLAVVRPDRRLAGVGRRRPRRRGGGGSLPRRGSTGGYPAPPPAFPGLTTRPSAPARGARARSCPAQPTCGAGGGLCR